MMIGPASPVDPNCQAEFLSAAVSVPAAPSATVMTMMFSQSVPRSRAKLPFPRTRSRITSPASSASQAVTVNCTITCDHPLSAKVVRELVVVLPASR